MDGCVSISGLFINYIMQLGEGGGKHLCYDEIKSGSKLVSMELEREEGGG